MVLGISGNLHIYIYLGKFHHDLTVLPKPGIMVRIREIIPFYGPTIQVSEISFHLPRYIIVLVGGLEHEFYDFPFSWE